MSKVKKVFIWISQSVSFPRNVFDYTAVPYDYKSPDFPKTTEDAWARDWENIGQDFRRAVARFEKEHTLS